MPGETRPSLVDLFASVLQQGDAITVFPRDEADAIEAAHAIGLDSFVMSAERARQADPVGLRTQVADILSGYRITGTVDSYAVDAHEDVLSQVMAVVESAQPVEPDSGLDEFGNPAGYLAPVEPGPLAYAVTFNHVDRPRTALVQLPPIGEDGRCTGCGKTPSRETGSCGCHFDVARRLGEDGRG